jgi:hypothetical protein
VRNAPSKYDVSALQEARKCYAEAEKRDRFDLYAALNVYRLDLILAAWEPQKYASAIAGFEARLPLCEFEAKQNPADRWRLSDWAEALLFSNHFDDAKRTYQAAIEAVPPAERQDFLRSLVEPLESYLISTAIPDSLKQQVAEILKHCSCLI